MSPLLYNILKTKLAEGPAQTISSGMRNNIMSGMEGFNDKGQIDNPLKFDMQDLGKNVDKPSMVNTTFPKSNIPTTSAGGVLSENVFDKVTKDYGSLENGKPTDLHSILQNQKPQASKLETGLMGDVFTDKIPEISNNQGRIGGIANVAQETRQSLYDVLNPKENNASRYLPSIQIPIQKTIRDYVKNEYGAVAGQALKEGQPLPSITDSVLYAIKNRLGAKIDLSKLNKDYPLIPKTLAVDRFTPEGGATTLDTSALAPPPRSTIQSTPGLMFSGSWPF